MFTSLMSCGTLPSLQQRQIFSAPQSICWRVGLVIGTEYIVLTTCSHGNTCCRMSSTRMDAVDMATQFVVVIGSIVLRQDKPVFQAQ